MKCLQQWIRSGTWLLLLSLLANHAIGIERNHGACDDSSIFTHEQHEAFQRDGFLVVSKLLDEALLDQLSRIARVFASENKNAQGYFTSQKKGVIFNGGIGGVANATTTTTIKTKLGSVSTKLFRDVALYSALPKAAAELMQLDPSTQNVRVLRDVFLAKGLVGKCCDWHVDDQDFWPESFESSASMESGKDQTGINVWIALDDMPAEYGGSMLMSAGSHKVPWRHDAYLAIGQNHSDYRAKSMEESADDAQELINKGLPPILTCSMSDVAPELASKLEKKRRDFDIRKGDIILASRMAFHKTIDVTDEGLAYYESKGMTSLNRYSIRYTPGSAKLPNGWNLDFSLALDPENAGLSLDDVDQHDGVWYPKVWPEVEENMEDLLDRLAETKLIAAERKVSAESRAFRSRATSSIPRTELKGALGAVDDGG